MATPKLPEAWLRGPVENIPALVQPVAHALLQAREEVNELMQDFPDELLWIKPADAASTGFHLQHLSGVLDRLFTYAKGQTLSEEQLKALKAEGNPQRTKPNVQDLVHAFNQQVDKALEELQQLNEQTLTESRGRKSATSIYCNGFAISCGRTYHASFGTVNCYGKNSKA
jgi:hypothetical protein